jgi:hypothetical protein
MGCAMDKYWIVWCENGGTPTVPHQSLESAQNEAKRLAKMNQGRRFWVLQALGYMQIEDPVRWTEADALPF